MPYGIHLIIVIKENTINQNAETPDLWHISLNNQSFKNKNDEKTKANSINGRSSRF